MSRVTDERAAEIRASIDRVTASHAACPPGCATIIETGVDITDLADLLDERDRLLAVVDAACRHEDTRERYQAEPGDSAPLYVEFIKAGGDLTAAVRAYRATTGEVGR